MRDHNPNNGVKPMEVVSNGRRPSGVRSILRYIWRDYSVLVALVLMVVIASVINPRFLTVRNLTNILRQVSVIGIVSMGMTMVILSGGIDLSVGSVLAFSGVVGMSAMECIREHRPRDTRHHRRRSGPRRLERASHYEGWSRPLYRDARYDGGLALIGALLHSRRKCRR